MTSRRPRRRGASIYRILVAIVVITLIAGGAWGLYVSLRPSVTVTRLIEGPVIRAVYATGTVSPVREYAIRTAVAGTLQRVLVDKGSRVAAGQALAMVVDPALDYALNRAKAELVEKRARADAATSPVLAEFDARIASAAEQLTIAQREEGRLRGLIENNLRSTTDLDRAADRTQTVIALVESLRSQRASKQLELQREVDTADAAVQTAQFEVDQQQLTSPIDGVVLDRPTSEGTRAAINDTLMRVADVTPTRLVMRAAVDEEDVTSVRLGQKVIMTLYAFPGQAFVGKVQTIYDEADPSRRTFEVDVAIERPSDRFQPGMTGELAFVIEERERATIVPSQAVQEGGVYVLRSGKIERVTPQLGVRSVDRVEIVSGLDAGDRVVISPVTAGQIGKRPRVTEVDAATAVGLPKDEAMRGASGLKAH